jgi:hypothetical protein
MMKTSTRTWTSILAVVAALGVTGSAQAQPHRDEHANPGKDHRDDRDHHLPGAPSAAAGRSAEAPGHGAEAPGRGAEAAPSAGTEGAGPSAAGALPPAEAKLAERLHRAEEKRQQERKLALKDPKGWNEGRAQRAVQHKNEIANAWGKAVSTPDAQTELKKHAERMARLNRILDIANEKNNTQLATRVQTDIQAEIDRDAQVMQAIRSKAGTP